MAGALSGGSVIGSIVKRAKAIISNPKEEWKVIRAESRPSSDIFMRYMLPLSAIGPIAGFFGGRMFGGGLFSSLASGVVGFAGALAGTVAMALVATKLAPKFGGEPTGNNAFKLVVFSSTAAWLAGAFALIPSLGIFTLLGLYSLYLFYEGAGPLLKIPDEKRGAFTGVMLACGVAIGIATSSIAGTVGYLAGGGNLQEDIQINLSNMPDSAQITFDADDADQIEDLTQGEIKPVSAEDLAGLFPERIGPYSKVDSESSTVGEIASTAQASYRWRNYSFDLSIADLTAMGAVASLLQDSDIQYNRQEDDGYEKLGKVDGRMVHEKWDDSENNGTYEILVGDRFMVKAEGNTRQVDGLRAAVNAIDEEDLADLAR